MFSAGWREFDRGFWRGDLSAHGAECRLYLGPGSEAPVITPPPKDLRESVRRTSVTGADHQEIMRAK
jgi:hypothetical protein